MSQDELNRLLALAHDSPHQQFQLVVTLGAMWDSLTPPQQTERLRQAIEVIGRCRGAVNEDAAVAMFHRLRTLPQEDILDALRFNPKVLADYTFSPGEEVYPTASPTAQSWLARYLWWARTGNAPLGFHAWSALSILGTVAQRRIFFPGARRIWLNMYIMLGGVRSSGKGQAHESAMKILHLANRIIEAKDWDEDTKRQRRLNILPSDITAEAIITDLKGRVVVSEPGDQRRTEDGMVEVDPPHEEQRADATGIIPLDEAATFFGKDAWGVARKGPMLTEMKEADRYTKRTKKDGLEELSNLALGMLACCAPDWMQGTIDTNMLGGGLMDRIVWVHREPVWQRREQWNIRNAPPRDPLVAEGLAHWLVDNVLCMPTKVPAEMTPGAEQVVDGYYAKLVARERAAYERFGADMEETTANRAVWATIQVATLLAVSDGKLPRLLVDADHAQTAVDWIETENQSMKRFLKEAHRRRDQVNDQKIIQYVEECGGCCKLGSLHQRFRNEIGLVHQIKPFLDSCLTLSQLESVQLTSPRRVEVVKLPDHSCPNCTNGLRLVGTD